MRKKIVPIQNPVSFGPLLTAISNKTRWRILDVLLDEALPSVLIAKKVGIPRHNATKHLNQLCRSGIVVRGYGNVYRIAEQLRVDGERAIDTGPVLLRLDRQPATS